MRLAVVAVGRLKPGPERDLFDRYRARAEAMGRSLGITGFDHAEIPESRARREADRMAEEGAAILAKAGSGPLILLDERGKSLTSEDFAARVGAWRDEGREALTLAIGGADGLDPGVRRRADLLLSFGALTLPHQIVRGLVAEQLYRALTILAGHPYHRAGLDS